MQLPPHGKSRDDVRTEIEQALSRDADWRGGKIWSLVYFAGDDVADVLKDAYSAAFFTNGLGPGAFKSLRKFESEVIAMTAGLLGEPQATGNMTSGGTESIIMSMLVSRERARARGIERPSILVPFSAHPAYAKAAHYFDLDVVTIPLGADHRADVDAAAQLIDNRTAVVVASAFSYPYGLMDPVTELAALAQSHGTGCHVDACIGGFILPFLEQLGRPVPPWDFRVPGVTEISVDIHKYGYTPKGASVILHRDADWQDLQWFLYADWPSGLYGSPAIAGARPAAPIATAWAVQRRLGQAGYRAIIEGLMETVATVRAGVEAIDGLAVLGDPVGPVLAIVATDPGLDVFAIAEDLDRAGWHVNRNTDPLSIHLMLSPAHGAHVSRLLADFAAATARVRALGPGHGQDRPVRYS